MLLTAPNTMNPHSTGHVELHILNSYNATFRIPPRVKLIQFDGSNWSKWLGTFKAILIQYKAEDHLCYCTVPLMQMKWSGPMSSGSLKPTYTSTCHLGSIPRFLTNLPTQPSKIDGTSSSGSTPEPLAALQFLTTGLCSLRPALMSTNP